uniref:Uncharacterized protein n=1 Tax=Caenorhabditis japonica TaxID=281687 RepID=A0A8R1E384_CAEJA
MLINNYEMGKTNSVGASRTLDERIIGTSRLETIICANLSETELRSCQERQALDQKRVGPSESSDTGASTSSTSSATITDFP